MLYIFFIIHDQFLTLVSGPKQPPAFQNSFIVNSNQGMSDELGKSLQHSVNQKFGSGTYQVLEPIKRGADGYVYKIEYIRQKRLAALKVLPRYNLSLYPDAGGTHKKYKHDTNLQAKAENQIKIHESLRSNYVVKLYNSSKDDMNYYLFLEYMAKGDLADEISRHRSGMDVQRIVKIGLQLAKGIDTLHRKFVVHRDIKPQNVLINDEDEIKICDFSCAKMLSPEKNQLTGAVGTLQYMAPEIRGKYSYSVDIWSYGCLLYAMATGHVPFKLAKLQISEHINKITESNVRKFSQNVSKQFQKLGQSHKKLAHLLAKILVYNQEKRYKIDQVIQHPFFTGKELEEEPEQQNLKPEPKTCYSLQFLKRGSTLQKHQVNRLGKTTQQILNKHKDKYIHLNANLNGRLKGKEKQQIQINDQNVNILNKQQKVHKDMNVEDLMKLKMGEGRSDAGKIKNKSRYISDAEPNARKQEPSSREPIQPINLKGINFSQTIHSEIVTINQKGLKAESVNSDKTMAISPKGQHITLTYEGKSLFYELHRLPQKYMSHYKYYKDVVHKLRSLASSKDLKKRNQFGQPEEGKNCRTSREKEPKGNRTERPNSINDAEKRMKNNQALQCEVKSHADFSACLIIFPYSEPQSYTASIAFTRSSKSSFKPLQFEIGLSSNSSSKLAKEHLYMNDASIDKIKHHLIGMTVLMEFEGKPAGRKDRDHFKSQIEDKNMDTFSRWSEAIYKYCHWFQLCPISQEIYGSGLAKQKNQTQKQFKRYAQQSPKPQRNGNRYLAQKQRLYNITKNTGLNGDQNKQYNHRILLDNFTSKYR